MKECHSRGPWKERQVTSDLTNILAKQIAVDEFIASVVGYTAQQNGEDSEMVGFMNSFLQMCKIGHFANLAMAEHMEDFQRKFPNT